MESKEMKKLSKKELEARIKELVLQFSKLEQEKAEKFDKNIKLEKEILALKKDKKMAEYQAVKLIKEQNRLMKQLKAEQKKNTYKQRTKNIELGKIDLINLEQIKELSRILEEKNVALEKTEQENSEKDVEIQFLQNDLAESRHQLKENEKEFENKSNELKEQMNKKEKDISDLEHELNTLKQDHDIIKQKFEELEVIASQKQENIINKEALEALSKEMALKEAKIAELRLKLKEKISDYDEIRPIQQRLKNKEQEIEQLRKKNEDMKNRQRSEISKLQKDISTLMQKNEELQKKLSETSSIGEDIPVYIVQLR
ncbi:MAG: hypothetical protein HWN67_10590 [Candidatus Helarchaeota archaeon]|nr:hypothetical protein [Candidatus Helarchaeota archaeon]